MNVRLEAVEKSLENVIMFTEAVPANIIRNAVNKLVAEHAGICAIFNGNDEEGYQYIIGSAQKDVREAGNLLKEKFNARGGGSPKMVQGSVQAGSSQIKEALGM
jgi:alanyl-tRNA synthetase